MSAPENIHASGVLAFGAGILLRGPSGSGKSLLALLLIDDHGGMLVGDDRLDLVRGDGALSMAPPAALAGMIELRGRGIVRRPHVACARVDLVVDLVPGLERMPEEAFTITLMGVALPRCPVPQAGIVPPAHQLLLVREALRAAEKNMS